MVCSRVNFAYSLPFLSIRPNVPRYFPQCLPTSFRIISVPFTKMFSFKSSFNYQLLYHILMQHAKKYICNTEISVPRKISCVSFLYFVTSILVAYGPGSSVGTATELRAGRTGDRIPVGRDFPSVQTGPGAHPASCTMGTGSFPGVKYGRGVMLTTHPF